MSERFAIIDFETTGISPATGDRATEVALVLMEGERVVDRFASLMNAGVRVPSFITQLTGISNAMVQAAPPAAQVMAEAARFVAGVPLVAHNAAFDRKFWQAELALAGLDAAHPFACTVLLSRRLFPQARSHKLGELATLLNLPRTGRAHRALADAEVTAELLARMLHELRTQYRVGEPDHALLQAIGQCPKAKLPDFFAQRARAARASSTPVCVTST
jgi:DNA polymerase-3 subunit epsilon